MAGHHHHGILGPGPAIEAVSSCGEEDCFLTRRSKESPEKLIATIKSGGKVSHAVIPIEISSPSQVDNEDTLDIVNQVILSLNSKCGEHPVPPLPPDNPTENTTLSVPQPEPGPETKLCRTRTKGGATKCDVCDFENDSPEKVKKHKKTHKVRYCHDCFKYILDNSFLSHKKKCFQDAPQIFNCSVCNYSSPFKSALMRHMIVHSRTHECQKCHRTFESEDRLKLHETHHLVDLKCDHCPLSFKSARNLRKHIQNQHECPRLNVPGVGIFNVEGSGYNGTFRKGKEKPPSYACRECDFKTKYKYAMDRHIKEDRCQQKIKKPKLFHCHRCNYSTRRRVTMTDHLSRCRYSKAKRKRIVPMITNDHVREIHNDVHGISKVKLLKIIRGLTNVIGTDTLEYGLRDDLSDNMHSLSDFYTSAVLHYVDSKGRARKTAFARVKDINAIIKEIIKGRNIQKPLVALGFDSGQKKLVVTMSVYDKAEKAPDPPDNNGQNDSDEVEASDGGQGGAGLTDKPWEDPNEAAYREHFGRIFYNQANMSSAASPQASNNQMEESNLPDSSLAQDVQPNSNRPSPEDSLHDREQFGGIFYSQAIMSDVAPDHQNNNLEDVGMSDLTPDQDSIPNTNPPSPEDSVNDREQFGRIFYSQANMSDVASHQEDMEQDGNNNVLDDDAPSPSTPNTGEEEVNNQARREKTRDQSKKEPSAGGQKRALLIGCADQVPENRKTLDSFLEELKIWTIEEEFIIVGDCKIINILMGKS